MPEFRPEEQISDLLSNYYNLKLKNYQKLTGGQINLTYKINCHNQENYILQRLNPVFGTANKLTNNFSQATKALKNFKIPSPTVIKSNEDKNCVFLETDKHFWRLLTYINGELIPIKNKTQVASMAKILGKCHQALNRPKPIILAEISNIKNINNHYLNSSEDFNSILKKYKKHPNMEKIFPFIMKAQKLCRFNPKIARFIQLFKFKNHVIHADPKSNNFLFEQEKKEAIALVDWDTVNYGSLLLDLADALRSWTATKNNNEMMGVNEEFFITAVNAYQKYGLNISKNDLSFLVAAVRAISINLAKRYLIDSLAEVYFVWNSEKFSSLFEQNLTKGKAMLEFSFDLIDKEVALYNELNKI